MVSGMVSVSWDDFSTAAINTVRNLHTDRDFTDVILACQGEQQVKAHKAVLGASSSFFRSVLLEHPSDPYEHLFICLLEVPLDQLKKLVEFIYLGEVKIPEEELADFLDLGKDLQICGIIGHSDSVNSQEPKKEEPDTVKDPLDAGSLVPLEEDLRTEEVLLAAIKEEPVEHYEVPKVIKKDETSFKCSICDFSSSHYATVRKHKLSKHDGIKYQCDRCVKSFTDSSTLLRHKKSIHDGVVYRCDICQKTFSDGSALTRHKKKIHPSELAPLYDPFFEF